MNLFHLHPLNAILSCIQQQQAPIFPCLKTLLQSSSQQLQVALPSPPPLCSVS